MISKAAAQTWSWPVLSVLLILQLWAAHALAFFFHEYAHSFSAWFLGWKGNPFALDYGHPTLETILAQFGINQNVDERPIFASGHGAQAALIGAAGMVLGNGLLTYPLSRLGYAAARRRNFRGLALFFYWITVASIGNFIDYVPVRTFAESGDMYSLRRGLGWSPWTVLLIFGIPTAAVVIHFFLRVEPTSLRWLFPGSPAKRGLLVVLTALTLFAFYGAAGLLEGDPISRQLSRISIWGLTPMAALVGWFLVRR